MSAWTLTVRHGSDVSREGFETLDEALRAMKEKIAEVKAEGPLPAASLLRDFKPGDQVQARLQISGRGLRGPKAGIDVRGDGRLVPYRGGLRREELDAPRTPHEAVREALTGE